jgi:CBS domain-containing protein
LLDFSNDRGYYDDGKMKEEGCMRKARDIMSKEVITVHPETEVVQAARLLLEHRINGLPVVDHEGYLKGIICQSDLIVQQKKIPLPSFFVILDGILPLTSQKNIEKELSKIAAISVNEAMTPSPLTVNPDTGLEDIATLMVKHNVHTLPVLDQGKVVGIIGKSDVLRTLIADEGNH